MNKHNIVCPCPLCLKWDCDCEDILTWEEYVELVKEDYESK